MRRLLATAAAAAVLAAAPAISSADVTKWIAIDSVEASHVTYPGTYWILAVTGIREGEDAPSTQIVMTPYASSTTAVVLEKTLDRCHQMALLALAKPGRFRFEVSDAPGSPIKYLAGCTLTRID